MTQLKCEMCGGTDLIKQDGVFVCQSCGLKYSVEEIRSMMVEGTVEVQGTVKVDNSAFVEKYLANARRAKEKTDWEEVEKYYNMVEQNDPQNIEAVFYSAYGKAMLSLTDGDKFKREQKFNVFCKSISIIDDYYDISRVNKLKAIIQGMSADLVIMTNSSFVYHYKTQNNQVIESDAPLTYQMFAQAETMFIESIENIAEKHIEDDNAQAYLYRILIKHYTRCIKNKYITEQLAIGYKDRLMKANYMLKDLDASYIPEAIPDRPKTNGGCYVATCVYGSYDCPQVWTLRRFRDDTLASTWYGRAFIHTYYAISPTIVKWFGDTRWFKTLWKGKLDKVVEKLNREGVKNTPYEDLEW